MGLPAMTATPWTGCKCGSSHSSAQARRRAARPAYVTAGLRLDAACSLTERDRVILRLLRAHRVLTASQLRAMLFTDANTCQHRLTRLHRLHLVERFRLPPAVAAELDGRAAISPTGYVRITEYAYVLDLVGAQILAVEDTAGEVDVGRVRWRTEQALAIAASPRLAHTLGSNQVFVDLVATTRTTPGTGLVAWWGEQDCHDRFQGLVYPDGIGVWEQDGRRVRFGLEHDRGTETLARLARKLEDYLLLETALGWEFWLLVVVPGPRREAGARARLGRHGLAVATTSRGSGFNPAGAVWAPVFANPEARRVRLIDLTGWARSAASRQRIAEARARSQPRADGG